MKNKDLQKLLAQHPDDMEVVLRGGTYYESQIDLSVEISMVYPSELQNPDENTIYNTEKSDDYWNFSRVECRVLVIY